MSDVEHAIGSLVGIIHHPPRGAWWSCHCGGHSATDDPATIRHHPECANLAAARAILESRLPTHHLFGPEADR